MANNISLAVAISLAAQSITIYGAQAKLTPTADDYETTLRACFSKLDRGDGKKKDLPADTVGPAGTSEVTAVNGFMCGRFKTTSITVCMITPPYPEPDIFIRINFGSSLSVAAINPNPEAAVSVKLKQRATDPPLDLKKPMNFPLRTTFQMDDVKHGKTYMSDDFMKLSYDTQRLLEKRLKFGANLVATCNHMAP